MILKPWQIWLAFLLCLAIVIPAMGWLSVQTIRLDTLRETDRVETELARREAELQERISSALYRMDLKMLPLVAQEASRPYYVYKPFYKVANPTISNAMAQGLGGRGGGMGGGLGGEEVDSPEITSLPSPLLFQAPEFVLLHFQLSADKTVTSPQRPVGVDNDLAKLSFGVPQTITDQNEQRLRDATKLFSYESLLKDCPTINLPQFADNNDQSLKVSQQSVYSVPAVEKLQNAIKSKMNQTEQSEDLNVGQIANKAQVQRSRGADRVNAEFTRRRDSTQEFADQQWAQGNAYDNRISSANLVGQGSYVNSVREGVMQPLWVDDNLVFARRVDGLESPIVQVCWLDWQAIQSALKAEVADLLPKIEFEPIRKDSDLKLGTALTTIPVQLVVDSSSLLSTLAIESSFEKPQTSGLRLSLWVAWIGLGLASVAIGLLLYGVLQLSERRATFVSAVTHELRTPLTTFRMYAEMLAEKMVPEGKQQEYANTLRVQADRLSHLVENVLQFAKLERGSEQGSRETISVDNLFARFSSRLVERVNEAEMELEIQIEKTVGELEIKIQASTIEQIVFNLVDNACKYAKPSTEKQIEVVCERKGQHLRFCVKDHGPGVDPIYRKRMFKPFCKSDLDAANSAPGVGLGLALCRRMAASLGGRLFHEDQPGEKAGATFVLEIPIT